MRVLLAPDKFKDALGAAEVCAAMAAGVCAARPAAEIVRCPLADGGEGTGRVLAQALGAEQRVEAVLDPLGRERSAGWWLGEGGATAIVELAEAAGLWLLTESERSAAQTSSFGVGQLLRAALDAGAGRIMLCVGGSAMVDGGAGCLQALGWRLLDAGGGEIAPPACGESLSRISGLHRPALLPTADIEILCDVDNPLLGPRGAAAVFAPQKGASPAEVAQLAEGLSNWADILDRSSGRAVRDLPGGGASGGLPAGLAAALNARLVPGIARVAEQVKLDARLSGCDWCLTGEGRLDEQTVGGKVVAGVARHARSAGVPVAAFVGAAKPAPGQTLPQLARSLGLRDIVVITPTGTPPAEALPQTAPRLRRAVADYLSL